MTTHPLLEVSDLRIDTHRGGRVIVSRLALDAFKGETIGIVGESGSGKSMSARAMMGLLPPELRAQGDVLVGERNLLHSSPRSFARIRGTKMTLILQDPFTMLNPLMKCGIQITELVRDESGGRVRGKALRRDAEARLAEVGITDGRVVDLYPFQLSGGMRQRVGIAAALARDPDILIADEPTTALDTTTQAEVLGLLKRIQVARGMAVILITHDLRLAFSMCDRVLVMYAGSVMEVGPARAIDREPLHPYTLSLLLSEPNIGHRVARLQTSPRISPVTSGEHVTGCPFQSRCAWALPVCGAPIDLLPTRSGRATACVRIDTISDEIRATRVRSEGSPGDGTVSPATASVLLSVRGLTKVYEGRRGNNIALGGVDLEIRQGEAVGLVGQSGSGKTTLGRCVMGLEKPSGGTIEISGIDTTDRRELTRSQRKHISGVIQMVFQDPYSSLNPAHSIGWALQEALAARRESQPATATRVHDLLERVGLPKSYAARKPSALSGGERQRVAIARALAVDPRIIVCDEAVSALDVSVQAQILNLLRSLQEEFGLSYLMISHDLAVIRQVADRVYVLQGGLVVEQGTVLDVLEKPQHAHTRRLLDSLPQADHDWLRKVEPSPSPEV